MNNELRSQIHMLATMRDVGDPETMLKAIAILTAPDEVIELAGPKSRNVPTADAPNNGKPWTEDEDAYIIKHARLPYAVIADGLVAAPGPWASERAPWVYPSARVTRWQP